MPRTRARVGRYSTALTVWSAGPLPVSETFSVIVWRVTPDARSEAADAFWGATVTAVTSSAAAAAPTVRRATGFRGLVEDMENPCCLGRARSRMRPQQASRLMASGLLVEP